MKNSDFDVKKRNSRAQSTFEYILVVTAVIAVLIGFIYYNNTGFAGRVENVVDEAIGELDTITDDLQF